MGWLGNILKGVVGSIPVIGKPIVAVEQVAEHLLAHKQPMSKPVSIMPPIPTYDTASLLSQSPVMPGGGVATPSGTVGAMANPPKTYGGSHRSTRKTKRRTIRAAHRSTKRKKKSSRRLKFGSPAYRKKYLGHK